MLYPFSDQKYILLQKLEAIEINRKSVIFLALALHLSKMFMPLQRISVHDYPGQKSGRVYSGRYSFIPRKHQTYTSGRSSDLLLFAPSHYKSNSDFIAKIFYEVYSSGSVQDLHLIPF